MPKYEVPREGMYAKCGRCYFFLKKVATDKEGICRRFSPQVVGCPVLKFLVVQTTVLLGILL